MSATLVIIDMQKAMDDPRYGTRGQPGAEDAMARLLAHWRETGQPVVHIQDSSTDPDSPYAPDKPTHDFKPQVKPLEHEPVVEKRTANAFVGTDLMQVLEEYQNAELVMCGVHLHGCVESTVRMAADLGFMVFLPSDCVIAVDKTAIDGTHYTADEVHALTLGILDGMAAKVITSEALMGTEQTRPDGVTLQ